MQVRVYDFLKEDPEAKNWTGIVKDVGKTTDGERWIRVEIAPGITIETCPDRSSDPRGLTLIRPQSALARALDGITVNDPVTFSALIYGGRIADDTAMVQVPEMIARFDAIKPPQ